ncbi:MAG TPA: lipopolysaccharide kinase InaA family protein, partial [Planctomycetota bacterium]|nr:lipopolysaccharide kinase InaA family protein [Planctomycetota bacterium]
MPFHGSRLVVHPEYGPTFKAQGIATAGQATSTWAKDASGRSHVAEVRIPHAGTTAHLFIKTYHYPGVWRLRTLFVPARVRREYENLLGLAKLGLRVPRAVAYGETRVFGFLADSFLATEAIENAIDLRELAVDPSKSP